MATVPTGKLERELRGLYLRWVDGIPNHSTDLEAYVERFRRDSTKLINQLGGQVARLGVAADFPAPKELALSPVLDHVYDTMKQVAIQQGVATGANARVIAAAMQSAGLDQSYNKLERLARTEVVSAYWQNQWDEAEDLGLVMLWSSENGPRTCPWCLAKHGLLVKQKTVRDHPNGRCTLVAKLPNRVPLRGKSRNPQFLRKEWDGTVPKAVDQQLGRGLDHALVASLPAQQGITGMVSQGWTSADAARYFISRVPAFELDRDGWSQMLRSFESYAQELWESLALDVAPATVYRGGTPYLATGLSSWTTDKNVAEIYAMRNGGELLQMQVPQGLYAYQLQNNSSQAEYLILGTYRAVETGIADGGLAPVTKGILDGPTPYINPPIP